MWNSANVHIRKNKHANLFFESSGFAYTLLICCISKWHQLFLSISRQRLSQLFWDTVHPNHCSSQCQTQQVNNKDNTQTPHRKTLGQKWSHNLLAVRLLCSPLCHPAFWNDYCTVFLLNSCVILNIKFHWQHFHMQKKKKQPQKVKTKTKDNGGEMQWGTIRAFCTFREDLIAIYYYCVIFGIQFNITTFNAFSLIHTSKRRHAGAENIKCSSQTHSRSQFQIKRGRLGLLFLCSA